ncbi:DUF4360 domain-containing protein [Zooshikella marina]|uniref:DUF4360 domain-containing protein n=1 Tax=Zooshikella ganghwensis TaxID=202772 RepID=A0A4P9VL24_9GAMM|nr:DUF4360 domain-containing protein [Zooshikella ganghwensis]MBU2708318.1 DUF4360 domain-containing protein [Zooshikella ganghwensis]RDH44035.1 DUF4360 domain-containing protein [Zooshikella ganghwensis]
MKTLALVSALALSTSAMAFDSNIGIDPDKVRFLGGCSGFVDTNPDKSFDIIFDDQPLAESYTLNRVRKTCVIKFPIRVPAGFQIAISRVGLEGTAEINDQGKGLITLRHRLAGTTGNAAIQEFYPADFTQNLVIRKDFAGYSYSPCGQDVTFKTSVTLEAKNGRVVIDEAAGSNAVVTYGYQMVQCQN